MRIPASNSPVGTDFVVLPISGEWELRTGGGGVGME